MTQLGVQICKTSFYGFSTKKDICKSKKHIGDTELIEKKWESRYLVQENSRQRAKSFRRWFDWQVGEIKKESEWLEQSELGLQLLDHDPQWDINFLLEPRFTHTHSLAHTQTHTHTLNSKFHKECLPLSCAMHPDVVYSILFYFIT